MDAHIYIPFKKEEEGSLLLLLLLFMIIIFLKRIFIGKKTVFRPSRASWNMSVLFCRQTGEEARGFFFFWSKSALSIAV